MSENQEHSAGGDPHRQALIRDLNGVYGLSMEEYLSAAQLEELLAERLNTMIRDDFNGLVGLLYRIDINEGRLRQLLHAGQGMDAGKIIARLIIDRQLQKIESRKIYGKNTPGNNAAEDDCGEEKW